MSRIVRAAVLASITLVSCGSPEVEPVPALGTLPGIEQFDVDQEQGDTQLPLVEIDRLYEEDPETEPTEPTVPCEGICEPATVGSLAVAERLGTVTITDPDTVVVGPGTTVPEECDYGPIGTDPTTGQPISGCR